MKKLLLTLVFMLVTAMTWAHSFTAVNADGQTIYYSITNSSTKTVSVTYNGSYGIYSVTDTYTGVINIPSTVVYNGYTYSVMGIDEYAFYSDDGVTSVTIPNSVTSIGIQAFYSCSGLTSIVVSEGNPNYVSIDGVMFDKDMTSLIQYPRGKIDTQYTIPNSVTSIGNSAFFGCSGLTSVEIPNSVTSIGDNAFSFCSGLTSVTIGNSVASIGNYAFSGCSGLTSVAIPNSVTSIGDFAFSSCSGLTSVTIPNSVTSVGSYVFSGCSGLTSVTIPNSVTSIGDDAFENCSGLTSVSIPNSVTSIGYSAFENCSGLTSVSIPNSVTSIGSSAFSGVEIIFINGSTPATVLNTTFSENTFVFVDNSSVSTYKSAWSYYANCIFPKSSLEVGANTTAADGHSALLEAIGGVGKENDVVGLKVNGTINGYDIMLMRNKLKNLRYLDLSDATIVPEKDNYQYYTGYYTQENILGAYSFYDVDNLRSVILPKNITSIGSSAFRECGNLTEVTGMPESCTNIGNNAFYKSKINKVEIGTGVISIGSSAFSSCSSLKNISIPASVKTIGGCAFLGCGNLETVNFTEGLETIESSAFGSCALTELRLPASLKTIGDGAFSNCLKLTELRLPASLKTIGGSAFSGCSRLKEIHIPSMLTSIGDNAFKGCTAAKDVYSYTLAPINIAQNSFIYDGVTLHAPQEPEDVFWDYYNNTQWSQFTNVVPFEAKYSSWYMGEDKDITVNDGETIPNEDDEQAEGTMQPGSGLVYEEGSYQWLDKLNLNWKEGKAPSLLDNGDMYVDELVFKLDIKANKWYFFCFPFDIDLDKAKFNGKFVWRYYDGDERAANGQGGWKNVVANEQGKKILRAYQGYIFQTNQSGEVELSIIDPVFTAKDKQVTIAAHPSNNAQDASWNLVGNPNISYYDLNSFLNSFDKPITVWDPVNNTYNAVMPGDDDYEFHPFEAFFVQKPTDQESIKFDNNARETYNDTQANAMAKAKGLAARSINPARRLVNIAISNGEQTDKTRVVFNDDKTLGYDEDCDAGKFMSTEAVPQIFTVDNSSVKYAINERPNKDNTVKLGYVAAKAGTYTIAAQRLDLPMAIKDTETGAVASLAEGEYTFESEAGIFESRFLLVPEKGATGVKSLQMAGIVVETVNGGINLGGLNGKTAAVYNANGTTVTTIGDNGHADVPAGTYIVTVGENSSKVVVK